MLKRFWRTGKPPRSRLATQSKAVPASDPAVASQTGRSFFELPAEIRNDIYEHVARSTSLRLRPSRTKEAPPPALLLVASQTRKEYVPILLSLAHITACVTSFDFHQVKRVIGSLYSTELKALRSNNNLTIKLLLERGQKEHMRSLRRWLVSRAAGMDRLPWRYEADLMGAWGQPLRHSLLNAHLEAMSQLHANLDEILQWELEAVIYALEEEL